MNEILAHPTWLLTVLADPPWLLKAYTAAAIVFTLNRFRDAFPAACCVLPVCCLAAPIPRSLLRGFFIAVFDTVKLIEQDFVFWSPDWGRC